jgi:hypothetical protein
VALLDNSLIREGRAVFREYTVGRFTGCMPYDQPVIQDTRGVEVQLPERDWQQIVQIVQAHERAVRHPAVQHAWEQYCMLVQLTRLPQEIP